MNTLTVGKGVLEDILLLSTIMSGDIAVSSYNEDGSKIATIQTDSGTVDLFAPSVPPVCAYSDYTTEDGEYLFTLCADSRKIDIYGPETVKQVEIENEYYDGVKLGGITVDGNTKFVYAPSAYFVPELTTGVKIGTFVFNGVSTDVFAPAGGSNVHIEQFPSKGGMDNPTSTFISVDNDVTLISSDDVAISTYYTTGKHLATVRINDYDYEIWCPCSSDPCPY